MARSTAASRPEGRARMETPDLLLRKARLEDWRDLYRNVWSRPEAARHMLWRISENEQEVRERMERTAAFQQDHDVYLIIEKKSGQVGANWASELSGGRHCNRAGFYRQRIWQADFGASVGLGRRFGRAGVFLFHPSGKRSLRRLSSFLWLRLSAGGG